MAAPNPSSAMRMNSLIRSATHARRRDGWGLIDRMRDTELNTDDRQRRFHEAVAAVELATKRRDGLGREMAEARLDAVLDEAREARQAEAETSTIGQPPAEPPAPVPSWDGGVRRPIARRPEPLTMGDALRAEMASRDEIRARNRENTAAWRRGS